MTVKDRINSYLFGNTCTGLEVFVEGDHYTYRSATIIKKGDAVEIENTVVLSELEELDKQYPVALLLEGKGVIHKLVNYSESDIHVDTIAKQVLPNVSLDDFYIQFSRIHDCLVWVAIARKNVVDELLQQCASVGISVIDFFIGPVVLSSVLSLTNEAELNINGLLVQHQAGVISNISKAEPLQQNITVGDERISTAMLLPFAAALHTLLAMGRVQGDSDFIQVFKEEYRQKRILKLGTWAALIIILVISMGNYFAFDHYHSKYAALDNRMAESAAQLQVIDGLKETLLAKKTLLEQTGLLEPSKTAYYADRIAKTVPRDMLLESMEVFPAVMKKLKGEKTYTYDESNINVSGFVDNSSILNGWVKELNELDWITEVVIVNYEKVKKSTESRFELQLKLKDAE